MDAARHTLLSSLPHAVRERLWAAAVLVGLTVDEVVCGALRRPSATPAQLAAGEPFVESVSGLAWPEVCSFCAEDVDTPRRCIFCNKTGCTSCVSPSIGCSACVAARAAEAAAKRPLSVS